MFTFSLELRYLNFKNAINFGQTGPQRLWVNFLLLQFYVTWVCVCVCVCEFTFWPLKKYILDYSRFKMFVSFCYTASASVIHTHIATLFKVLFSIKWFQSVENTSLCYTVVQFLRFEESFVAPWTVASQARILEWVDISFSRKSSPSRDWSWVFCMAGRFFTIWATREGSYCTVGPYELSILYIAVCMSIPVSLFTPSFLPGNHKFVFYMCDSISVL